MPARFDVDLETVIGRSFRRDWADARSLHSFWPRKTEREKIFHGRRAGEGDQIRPLFQKTAARAGNIARFRNCPICKGLIDYRSQLREFLRKHVPRLFSAGDQDSKVFDPTLLLKFTDDGFGHEILRLKIDMEMKIADPLRGRRADGGKLRPTNLARVVVKLEKHFEERAHAIWTGKDNPIVLVRVLDELTEFAQIGRRFDPDRRQINHVSAESTQLTRQRSGLFPRPRHNDPFSGQRPVFVPL